MRALTILKRKEVKNVLGLLEAQFGFSGELEYAFLQNNEGKIYIVNKECLELDMAKLRVNSFGMYFGFLANDGFRLTIEGAQLIGKDCSKNVVDIGEEEMRKWLSGADIEYDGDKEGYLILRCGEDYLGSGKIKEKKILNFVGKARRLNVS